MHIGQAHILNIEGLLVIVEGPYVVALYQLRGTVGNQRLSRLLSQNNVFTLGKSYAGTLGVSGIGRAVCTKRVASGVSTPSRMSLRTLPE